MKKIFARKLAFIKDLEMLEQGVPESVRSLNTIKAFKSISKLFDGLIDLFSPCRNLFCQYFSIFWAASELNFSMGSHEFFFSLYPNHLTKYWFFSLTFFDSKIFSILYSLFSLMFYSV